LLQIFGTISGLIVDCFENDKSPIHLLYCGRLLKYGGAHLTMLSFSEIPGDEGDVSMDIYGIILTSYSEKYLYQLTGMETVLLSELLVAHRLSFSMAPTWGRGWVEFEFVWKY
jgi:hypothetical protein